MGASLQKTIESIEAVKSCKVMEDQGEISQIYVEAALKAKDDEARTQEIKSIVRSIIGAAAIHHDLDLDYRKIKVIEYKPSEDEKDQFHPRIQIVAAYIRRVPRPECVVELLCQGRTYQGSAPMGYNLAESTFHAFRETFHKMGFGYIELDYIQILQNDFAQERVVLLKLIYSGGSKNTDSLMGIAEIREDMPLAVVKACLDAVNRQIVIHT